MKKIQNFYLHSYRTVGFVFLTGLIASILWYGFSILFFMGNSNWSIPMILSASQEKVMTHLEHILVFEHRIIKNNAELVAAKQSLNHKKTQLKINQALWQRLNQSINEQSLQDDKTSAVFKNLSQEKKNNVDALIKLTNSIEQQEHSIDKELRAGLITKQEAILAHITWHKMLSSLVDSKVSLHDLKKRSNDYKMAANTLNGLGHDLQSMDRVMRKVELESQIAQIKNDIFSLTINIKQLNDILAKETNVLNLMADSPYILATKKSVSVAFVPYKNLSHVKVGTPVFSCYFDMIVCYQSGYVSTIYSAEEYDKHPIFKSDLKGQLVGIAFDQEIDKQKKLLFISSKPLLI